MKHTRKCWGCGNVAEHTDNVAPHVCCTKCGSQDTRKMKHSIHCSGYRGPGQGFDIGSCDCDYRLSHGYVAVTITPTNADARVSEAIQAILDGLSDWDAEAQQNAQTQQTPEAWTETMGKHIGDVLKAMVAK